MTSSEDKTSSMDVRESLVHAAGTDTADIQVDSPTQPIHSEKAKATTVAAESTDEPYDLARDPDLEHYLEESKSGDDGGDGSGNSSGRVTRVPLERRELWSWYSYGWATEPFATIVTGAFMPIVLTDYAAMSGVQTSDLKTACDISIVNYKCSAKFGAIWVTTDTYSLLVNVITVLIQAILYCGIGALADRGTWRKKLLLVFAVLGGVTNILFLAVNKPELYWAVALLYILAFVFYGCSYVFYYSYLPLFTVDHPRFTAAVEIRRKAAQNADNTDKPEEPDFCDEEPPEGPKKRSPVQPGDEKLPLAFIKELIASQLSAYVTAWCNGAGVLVMAMCGGIALAFEATDQSLLYGCALVGGWWLLFTIPSALYLNKRPGPPLPKGRSVVFYGYSEIGKTIRSIRKLKHIFKFLLAWFLLADGAATVLSVAVIFARSNLNIEIDKLLIAIIIAPFTTVLGAFLFMYIQRKFLITTRVLLMWVAFGFLLLPVYIIIGFGAETWGLNSKVEIFPIAGYFGVFYGANLTLCRSLYADLIPSGMETELYSLFQVTDKGSAWIGPLVAAIIGNATGNLRYGFIWMACMFVLGGLVVYTIDVPEARHDAREFSKARREERQRELELSNDIHL